MNTKGKDIIREIYTKGEMERIEKIKERNKKFEGLFKKERESWNKKLETVLNVVYEYDFSKNNSKPIINAQAYALSYRQEINSLITKHTKYLSGIKVELRELEQEKTVFYTIGMSYTVFTNATDKKKMIEGSLRENLKTSEILESHIEYLRDSMKTLDNFQYSIKNVIGILEMLGR